MGDDQCNVEKNHWQKWSPMDTDTMDGITSVRELAHENAMQSSAFRILF